MTPSCAYKGVLVDQIAIADCWMIKQLNELGFKERRVGSVTILDTDSLIRIKLRFGGSSIPLADAAESLLANGQRHILLNLVEVNSIGAKGLGDLVSTHVIVKNGGGEFRIFNPSPAVRQLMIATNLFAVFALYESEKDALESFVGLTLPITAESPVLHLNPEKQSQDSSPN